MPVRLAIGGARTPAAAAIRARGCSRPAGGTGSRRGPSSTTERCYKPVAVDTTIQSSAELLRPLQGQGRGHAHRDREPFRRLDDDPVVGQQAHHEGRPPRRSGPAHPAGQWARRHGQGRRHPRPSRHDIQGLADDIIAVNGLEDTNLIVGQVLVLPGAKGDPIPTPMPTKPARAAAAAAAPAGGVQRRPEVHRRRVAVAGPRRRQLHQPVLPLRPLRDRHRGELRDARCRSACRDRRLRRLENNGCGYSVILRNSASIYTMYSHNSARDRLEGPVRVARPADRAHRAERDRDRSPLPLRGLDRLPPRSGSYFVNPLRYY